MQCIELTNMEAAPSEVRRTEWEGTEMWGLFWHRNAQNKKCDDPFNEDVQELLNEEAESLYLLAFLLTANQRMAERCFVASLDDCVNGTPTSERWARSWARRRIVRNAVRMIAPHSSLVAPASGTLPSATQVGLPIMPLEFAAFGDIVALDDFERFEYVLSVLERYPEQDCALLLDVSRQEVRNARDRALKRIATCEKPTAELMTD